MIIPKLTKDGNVVTLRWINTKGQGVAIICCDGSEVGEYCHNFEGTFSSNGVEFVLSNGIPIESQKLISSLE